MDGQNLVPFNSINCLGVEVSNDLNWKPHIVNVAKAASKKLFVLRKSRKFLSPEDSLFLYKTQIRLMMEYCSFIWDRAAHSHIGLLDNIEKRALKLINCQSLTEHMESLSSCRKVVSLYVFYRMHFGLCSSELAMLVPPTKRQGRVTRQSEKSHPFA